jgi:hypothetical protein
MKGAVIILVLLSAVVHAEVPAKGACTPARFKKVRNQSQYIAVAIVDRVLSPPGYWSGMFAAMQLVQYKPISFIKGHVNGPSLIASHYVVSGSSIADLEKPQLARPSYSSLGGS